jgi:dTDP-4-amino-4,6-dideoxygalactose transaminase
MKVPFFDWAGLYRERADEFARIMDETASRGGFILQRDVDEFEDRLARFIGVKHVVGLSDATHAMLLGLRACELQPGSEVIIPSHCFIAAAQAVHHAGGINVPVELSADDWLVDPAAIEAAITPRTRAIMPVHVNGRTARMDAIMEIAARHDLEVFEDSAQAAGASLNGRGAGTFGRWGVFSFYPSKTLGCFGDAGALVTDDDGIADKVRRMRNHGAGRDKVIAIDVDVWGTNSRMDNIQAAILNHKLTYYDRAIARRREIAARYHQAFSGIDALRLPPPPSDEGPYFDIFQNYELCTAPRDALRRHLAGDGIGTIVQWGGIAIHQFRGLGFTADLPRTDRFFRESLLLPMNHILTDQQVGHVIRSVVGFFEGQQ